MSWVQDLHFAVRSLVRRPGFSLLSIALLALGIGTTVAMFSVTHALMLQPLPYANADRVMVAWRVVEGVEGAMPFSFPTVDDLKERNRAFESMAVFVEKDLALTGASGDPERLRGLLVSGDLPATLGVNPHLGRGLALTDDQPGAPRTVLLSHELWSRRFGGDEAILSRSITLDGLPYTVIGVLPADLRTRKLGPYRVGDFWIPIGLFRDQLAATREESPELFMVGRLRQGLRPEDGRQDLERIARELSQEHAIMKQSDFAAVELFEDVVGEVRPILRLLIGGVGFVLIIACANLANLLLARGVRRRQEFATRAAVGAGRMRLARQVITETLVLGLLGGGAGLLLAQVCLEVLASRLPAETLGHVDLALNAPVVFFALLITLLAVLGAGLIPALRAPRASFRAALRAPSNRAPQRLEKLLVGAEIAVAVVLLIGAALMLSSLLRLRDQDPGFRAEGILSAHVTLPTPKYSGSDQQIQFYESVLRRVGDLGGVEGVAITSNLPLVGNSEDMSVVAARDRPLPGMGKFSHTLFQMVSPTYFRTMGIPLIYGRDFNDRDDMRLDSPKVVVINHALASHFWPGAEAQAIGKKISFEVDGTPANPDFHWREVVGVVGDVRHGSLRTTSRNAVYLPFTQPGLLYHDRWPTIALVAKTGSEPLSLTESLRLELQRIDSDLPIYGVSPLNAVVAAQLRDLEGVFTLFIAFAALAVVLAMVGVYGVVSQTVASSTQEIGTRVALGAAPAQVVRGLLRQTALWIIAGLVSGLLIAALMSRSLASLLYGIGSLDPLVYAGSALVVGLVTVIAILGPALQAARLDPSKALRED
ncbi:MAG: ABC transporter permease [Acidobacteriota bacterium]